MTARSALIEQALNEDIGFGDVTSESLIPEDQFGRAILQAKENGVVSGMEVVGIVMQYADGGTTVTVNVKDGDFVSGGMSWQKSTAPSAEFFWANESL